MHSAVASAGIGTSSWALLFSLIGDKPFSCDICHKKFALSCNLRAHLKTHEAEYSQNTPPATASSSLALYQRALAVLGAGAAAAAAAAASAANDAPAAAAAQSPVNSEIEDDLQEEEDVIESGGSDRTNSPPGLMTAGIGKGSPAADVTPRIEEASKAAAAAAASAASSSATSGGRGGGSYLTVAAV